MNALYDSLTRKSHQWKEKGWFFLTGLRKSCHRDSFECLVDWREIVLHFCASAANYSNLAKCLPLKSTQFLQKFTVNDTLSHAKVINLILCHIRPLNHTNPFMIEKKLTRNKLNSASKGIINKKINDFCYSFFAVVVGCSFATRHSRIDHIKLFSWSPIKGRRWIENRSKGTRTSVHQRKCWRKYLTDCFKLFIRAFY